MIKVEDITKIYRGGITALKSVSLIVGTHEVFGLLGPNGAGKTTLMKILTTQISPTSGTAYINNLNIAKDSDKLRKIIGYVPQDISVQRDLTGYENLLFYAKLYDIGGREMKKRIVSALNLMELRGRANGLVKYYSGGMMRRLELAESLVNHPKVLFLDEPTIGLDPSARKKVWEKILKLRTEHNITIFINTHYMNEAEEYCDRIAIINAGKIIITGTPASLKKQVKFDATMDEVFIHFTGEKFEELEKGDHFHREARLRNRIGK